jgi:hypothetical protein
MSTYSGNFVVTNNTGGTITNCVVSHICSGQPTATLPPCTLANGETSKSIAFTTETSSKDRWSVSFVNSGNELRTGQENCGFESEDKGGTVTINLAPEDFDVEMPVSSSCMDNDYQQS